VDGVMLAELRRSLPEEEFRNRIRTMTGMGIGRF
jgi:hypothetical protein